MVGALEVQTLAHNPRSLLEVKTSTHTPPNSSTQPSKDKSSTSFLLPPLEFGDTSNSTPKMLLFVLELGV